MDAYPAGAILERVQVRELGEQARQQMIQRIETTSVNINAGVMSAQYQNEPTGVHAAAARSSTRRAA